MADFHSKPIIVSKLKDLASIDSDHLPLLSEFYISKDLQTQQTEISKALTTFSNQKIKEGEAAAKIED